MHERRWARDIAVNLGARWSDFSSFGQNTSWQAGLRWRVADQLTLRASYAEVFRTPRLDELHEPFGQFEEFGSIPAETIPRLSNARIAPPTAYPAGPTFSPTCQLK